MKLSTLVFFVLFLVSVCFADSDSPESVSLKIDIINATNAKIAVKNSSDKVQWIHNSLRHYSDDVPKFSWIKLRTKDGKVIDNHLYEDGRWSPLMPSSALASSEDTKMTRLNPGDTLSVVFPLGKFLNRAPTKARLGFKSVKLICRIYTEPFSKFIEKETEWVDVDSKNLWNARTYR